VLLFVPVDVKSRHSFVPALVRCEHADTKWALFQVRSGLDERFRIVFEAADRKVVPSAQEAANTLKASRCTMSMIMIEMKLL